MEVSEVTSVVKSIWLGSRKILGLPGLPESPGYFFLSGTSDKAFLCFFLWKALTSSHHSMRCEEGKKRNITWDCKRASSSFHNGKWDKITQILCLVWTTWVQFTCLNIDGGCHLRHNRVPGTPIWGWQIRSLHRLLALSFEMKLLREDHILHNDFTLRNTDCSEY